jgi:phosphatidylglycerol lysyltransferase
VPDTFEDADVTPSPRAIPRALPALRRIWPWLLLSLVAVVGWRELRQVDFLQVRDLLRATDALVVALLVIATAANLALSGFYDVAALGDRSLAPPRSRRWSTGVIAFAWSNFLTVGPLAGPALRLWLYGPLGVSIARSRRALLVILGAFTTGLCVWCAAVLLPLPHGLAGPAGRTVLAIVIGAAAAYGASYSDLGWGGEPLARRRQTALALAGVGVVDWLLAWAVFHLAVASQVPGVGTGASMRIFFVGQLVGLVSLVPGGFGSADLYWGARLASLTGNHDRIAAALLLYRAVYYALPFLFASLVLAGRFISAGRRTAAAARTGLASYAFFCGAVLLASAASPSLADRSRLLQETVPLALVEISHGASILLGFILILISRGLARGYRSSHRLSVALFLAAALTTFLKGLDYEEAILALGAAVLLILFRAAFTREGRLHPSLEFVASAGLAAVLLFGAVGLGSYDAWPDLGTAFSRFAFFAHEERFIRGLVVLASVAALVALRLGQRPRAPDVLPDESAIARALGEADGLARNTNPLLVATGDKALFRREDGSPGYIAYRTSGRFLVAWSDPVCAQGEEYALLSAFIEHAADWDREAVLYQISPALLPVAHDLGFVFFKLGEEAIVDLATFDLKGNKAKTQRHAINAIEKAGGRFRILEPDEVRANLTALENVSEAWLRSKGATEKGFSLGRFDPDYIGRFPCAVVETRDGKIVAFANILAGARGEELSVDLMRHADLSSLDLPSPMEYLILMVLQDAKARGFRRFNLGMAPLAAVGVTRRARPIERIAHQFFLHGEAWYNYQGLRRFKARFHPAWEPRYLAYRRPWDWPFAVAATTQLISGRWRALLPGKGMLT